MTLLVGADAGSALSGLVASAVGLVIPLADEPESRPVTEWPMRLGLTVAVLAFIALAMWGMWRGWAHRAARQSGIAAPQPAPASLGEVLLDRCPGVYLASTRAGDWLDRVVVHGLGTRSRADLSIGERGVLFDREGAPDLFVPASSLRAVRVDRGIAGAVYEQGGVVVVTWDLDGTAVDSGFRARRTEDHVQVAAAVERLLRPAEGPTKGVAS